MNKKRIFYRLTCFLILCGFFCFPSWASAPKKGVYSNNVKATKKVALTFDDGPHPRYTQQILDILDQYQIKATFFMIGVNVERYPETFQKILKSGCEIGNHTYSHHNIDTMSENSLTDELTACEESIKRVGGNKPTLFRPPRGMLNKENTSTIVDRGYSVVLWSIDTQDWKHTAPETICRDVIHSLKDGDIILMHDYVSGTNTTCQALELLIPEILKRGYEFVTISQLIKEDTA